MIRNSFLLCLLSVTAYCVINCVAHEAIIGGYKAASDQLKYQVSLRNNGQHFCGGGIIGQKFILTAAHCVMANSGQFKNLNYTVVAATNDLSKTSEPALTFEVRNIYVPTMFMPMYRNTADIAVVELHGRLGLPHNRHIRALLLPMNKDDFFDNSLTIISGFGWTWFDFVNGREYGSNNDTHLRWAEAKVLAPYDQCYHRYTEPEKHICARLEQNTNRARGVCTGDDGSPLVHLETVIGVLSKSSFGCSEREYGAVYTRVSEYRTFVRNVKTGKINKYIRVYVVQNNSSSNPSHERFIIAT